LGKNAKRQVLGWVMRECNFRVDSTSDQKGDGTDPDLS